MRRAPRIATPRANPGRAQSALAACRHRAAGALTEEPAFQDRQLPLPARLLGPPLLGRRGPQLGVAADRLGEAVRDRAGVVGDVHRVREELAQVGAVGDDERPSGPDGLARGSHDG
jgi:hypothetical protein